MPSHAIDFDPKGDIEHAAVLLPMTATCLAVRLFPLALWAGALAYFSLAPEVADPAGIKLWDKFSHFAAYAVLALLVVRVVTCWREPVLRWLAISWLLCCCYGLLLETLQWGMALGRQFEAGDLLANGLGALVGCAVFCRKVGR